MRSSLIVGGGVVALALCGCKSAFVAATVTNRSPAAIGLIEVDYPSASFGTDSLAAGAAYPYRFKVLGEGPLTVSWTDAAHHEHKSAGPKLREGDEGTLDILFRDGNAPPEWVLKVHPR